MRGRDLGVEYRCMDNRDSEDNKTGWLVELDKELFKYAMLGVGYNFTKYDDDLSNDDDYDAKGWFVRILGKY